MVDYGESIQVFPGGFFQLFCIYKVLHNKVLGVKISYWILHLRHFKYTLLVKSTICLQSEHDGSILQMKALWPLGALAPAAEAAHKGCPAARSPLRCTPQLATMLSAVQRMAAPWGFRSSSL